MKNQGWWIIAVIKNYLGGKNMELLCRVCPCSVLVLEARTMFHSEKSKRVGCKMVPQVKVKGATSDNLSSVPSEYTWYKDRTNSTTLSSDFHVMDVVCTPLN